MPSHGTLSLDPSLIGLNRPLMILSKGRVVLSGGHLEGYLFLSITRDPKKEYKTNILAGNIKKAIQG
jgi:hypothetical protein